MELTEWKEYILSWTNMSQAQWEKRQRILDVYNKVHEFRHDELCMLVDIIAPFTKKGFQVMVNQAMGEEVSNPFDSEIEQARFELENTLVFSGRSPTLYLTKQKQKTKSAWDECQSGFMTQGDSDFQYIS